MDRIDTFYRVLLPDALSIVTQMQDVVTGSIEGIQRLAKDRIVVLMVGDTLFLSEGGYTLLRTILPGARADDQVLTRADLPAGLTTMIADSRDYVAS